MAEPRGDLILRPRSLRETWQWRYMVLFTIAAIAGLFLSASAAPVETLEISRPASRLSVS